MQAYSDEELNYFRLCKIVASVIPEGLREIFKQQWDTHYTSTHGPWMDTPANFASFQSMESPRNRKKNKRLLGIMTNGDRTNWDSTCLSYAILFSDSIGPKLKPNVKKSVDILRESRNEVAHNAEGRLKDADFQTSVQNVLNEFITLKLDTTELLKLKNQTSFPTEEFYVIKKELDDEKKRNAEPKPFCVLPPKSFHDQITREHEVQDISKKMKELSNRKMGETTTVYLSGNPGCGKSVLAGQIGDEYFDSDDTVQPAFVMTINATNMDTLLQSYVEFATKLNCYPGFITDITTSKDLSKKQQIQRLKFLVAKQVDKYASWLMIIDNVVNLKEYSKYWPQFGDMTSGVGQILVTTQDEQSIAENTYTWHLSLKRGMTKQDSVKVLSKISDKEEDDEMMFKVAKSLDFQPLALACAGVYMKTTRASTTWKQFLEKLAVGKRDSMEKEFEKNSISMTVSVRMALDRETCGNEVIFHTFEFLSVLANDPIPTEHVVAYVSEHLPKEDEEVVASTIRSSSLVMTSDDGDQLTTHQIVHHCLQEKRRQEESEKFNMLAVISAFSALLKSFDKNSVADIIKTRTLLSHFENLSRHLPSYIVQQQLKCQTYLNKNFEGIINNLNTLGSVCVIHGRYHIAKVFFQLSLTMQLPSFINEMENRPFVDLSEFSHLHLLKQDRLNCVFMVARSVYDCTDSSEESPISIQDYHEAFEKINVAETMSSLGIAISNLGELSVARDCHEVALGICDLEYEHSYAWLKLKAEILNNLAAVSKEMGNMIDEKKCCQNASILHEEIHKMVKQSSSESEFIRLDLNDYLYIKASSYYGLGKSNYTLAADGNSSSDGYLHEAIKNLEKSLSSYRRVYGEQHPKVAHALNRLGRSVFRLRKYDQARHDHNQALFIYNFVYNENHPLVGSTLNNLGKTLLELHCYYGAAETFKESLRIAKRFRGDDDPTIGELQFNLAQSLSKQNHFNEARTFCENALAIFRSKYGEKHNLIVQALIKLADIYNKLGDYPKVLVTLDEAFERTGNINYITHIAQSYVNLGNTFRSQKRYVRAKRCYERSLASGYCSTRALIGQLLSGIGDEMAKKEKFPEAASCYINASKSGYGKDNPMLGQKIFRIGSIMYDQHQLNEAKTCYSHALTTKYGKDSLTVVEAIFELCESFFDQGKLNEANACYINALSIGYGTYLPFVGQAVFKLGKLFLDQGQLYEAKTCYINALYTFYGKNCQSVGEEVFKLGTLFFDQSKLNTGYDKDYATVSEKPFQFGTPLYNLEYLNDAAHCYIEALTVGYGKDCQTVGKQIFDLGKELYYLGMVIEAKTLYIAAMTTRYGKETPSVGIAIVDLFESFSSLGKYLPCVGQVILEIGKALYNLGQYNDAKPFYINALTTHGINHPSVGKAVFKLGSFFLDQGQLTEAKTCYMNALTTGYGKCSSSVGEALFELGTAFFEQDQLNDANTIYINALSTGYGKACPAVGKAIFKLGAKLFDQGQLTEAKQCYMNALSTGYDTDSSTVGEALFELGKAFFDQGQLNEAKTCYINAFTTGYGKCSSSVGEALFELGTAFFEQYHLNDANTIYINALSTGYGKDCRPVGKAIFKLGAKLFDQGQLTDAKQCYMNALSTGYDKDSSSVGEALFELGKAFFDQGQLNEAKTCYMNALTIGYGKDSLTVGEAIFELGESFFDQGKLNEANACYMSALTTGYGKDSSSVGEALFELGKAFFDQGQLNEAKTCYMNSLTIGYGKDCRPVGKAIFKLGAKLFDQGQLTEAKQCYMNALSTGYGKDSSSVGEALFELGKTFFDQDQLNEAKTCYMNALTIGYGKDCPPVGDAIYILGNCLYNQAHFNDAQDCYVGALSTGYAKDCPSIVESIVRFGSSFYDLREINVAKACYTNALASGYGMRDCPAMRDSICRLVISLYDLGLFTEAKTCFEECENAKCIDDHSLGTAKFNLGKAKYEDGDYFEAKTAFEQCLATGYGGKHPEVFLALGDSLYHLARYYEAEICYKTVLAAEYTSEDCPTLDTSFFNLGKAFYELGDYHQAQSCYKSVLAAGCNGEHLNSFCTSVIDLGETFCNLKQYNEARMCFESVLKFFRALNENDDLICLTLLKLLFTLESLECYESAVPYYEELLSNAKILYGRNSQIVADLYILLGETLEKLERHDEARKCFKKGKAILSLLGRIRRLLSSEQPHSTLNDIETGIMLLQTMRTSVQ
ncbi:uncharacterized protein LOC110247749 [Exaiptasia diaphana]|uniref:Uncharacterized protein n=1 Tax=Exaiptasia diaphana TaxID=2652724 RepID=A0A913XUB3_EXADI|nr:uncharacterized protein LOC110247749 [Exaiptasia diaphana]